LAGRESLEPLSVVQIEDTYARWLKRTDDQLRSMFDAYDEALAVSSATS
jgi:hypothetical protein